MKICTRCESSFGGDGDWVCPDCGYAPPLEQGVRILAPERRSDPSEYDPALFDQIAHLEEGHFWFEGRRRVLAWALTRYCQDARNLLEVGCGNGYVLAGLAAAAPGLEVTGADLHEEGLAVARRRVPRAELLQLDATRLPFEEEFDVIGAFDVLEHLDDDERALAEIHRALRPGGRAMIAVPQHPRLWGAPDEVARHRRRYTRSDLLAKLGRAGLEPVRVTSMVSLLLPAMAASRMVPRRCSEHDPLAELRISGLVNRVMSGIMEFEASMIRRGVDLPAGGSLLSLAQRPAEVPA